jgi:hypothetical protein
MTEEKRSMIEEIDSKQSEKTSGKLNIKRLLLQYVMTLLAVAAGAALVWFGYALFEFGAWGMYGNKIFYDEYHVKRHFMNGRNVRGEWTYHTVSGFYDFKKTLERAGYDIYVHQKGRITPGMLDGFDIYCIGEQTYQGTKMNEKERAAIFDFVNKGGGMWATAEHTNHHNIGDLFNSFMRDAGIQARFDSICEDNGTKESKDWVGIKNFSKHPVTEGLEDVYFFNGCSLDTEFGVAFSNKNTWSDAWNPEDPPIRNGNNVYDEGEIKGPFTAIAARTFGKGRIVVTGDHNPFANPSLHMGSNERLLLNVMRWLGKPRLNKAFYYVAAAAIVLIALFLIVRRSRLLSVLSLLGYVGLGVAISGAAVGYQHHADREFRILFAEVNRPTHTARSKERKDLWTLFEHILKTGDASVWLKYGIVPGYDALALVAPTQAFSEEQLRQVDDYLNRGKGVIYLATIGSLRAEAGRQLMKRFDLEVDFKAQTSRESSYSEFKLEGLGKIHRGVDKIPFPKDLALTHVKGPGWSVVQKGVNGPDSFDLIAEKQVGPGKVILISPTDLFEKKYIMISDYKLVFVDLIMNIFDWIGNG